MEIKIIIDDKIVNIFKKIFSRKTVSIFLVLAIMTASIFLFADSVSKPYNFNSGEVISANEMNSNFNTLYTKVNELDSAIENLEVNGTWWNYNAGDLYYNSGEVGIGTDSPNFDLDVDGDINFTGVLYEDGTPLNNGNVWDDATGGISYMDGNVGIGTLNPSNLLHILNSGSGPLLKCEGINPSIMISNSSTGSNWEIYHGSNDSLYFESSSGTVVAFEEDGNVGIGEDTPDYKLEVAGPIMLQNMAGSPSPLWNGAGIYTNSGELYAIDSGGNATQISPHDSETGEWIFYSKNVNTGRVIRINMEKLVKKVEEISGELFMEEWIE